MVLIISFFIIATPFLTCVSSLHKLYNRFSLHFSFHSVFSSLASPHRERPRWLGTLKAVWLSYYLYLLLQHNFYHASLRPASRTIQIFVLFSPFGNLFVDFSWSRYVGVVGFFKNCVVINFSLLIIATSFPSHKPVFSIPHHSLHLSFLFAGFSSGWFPSLKTVLLSVSCLLIIATLSQYASLRPTKCALPPSISYSLC